MNFKVLRTLEIPEIQVTLTELTHEPTGARVMHLAADDPENVFCLSFKTLPETSDGVAHMLEHIVLAGSQKYPVKDPFFAMTRRSLNTFMNAFTGSDFTCYPAATQVEKDFYNLLEVYIDAVFHPTLDRLSFLQEGHRLEFEEADNPDSPLLFKGVVFNEMKGALTSATSRLFNLITETLFPDITYGQNSGGDPKVIPTLTYENLVKFHKTFYHPSRCLFYFYGNLPLKQHLEFIEKYALKDVPKLKAIPAVPKQKRFDAPKYLNATYPADDSESLTYIALSWVTCPIKDQETSLALTILDTLLMGTDAAPLKMALLRSGYCSAAFSFLETDISEIPYGIILNGCKAEDADALESFVFETLKTISFTEALIESAFHQIEFDRMEITEEGYPHGLDLFLRAGLLRQHDINPEEALKIHTLFDSLRRKLKNDTHFFQKLIQELLLNNTHRVRIVMTPDTTLAALEQKEESDKLAAIRGALTEKEIETIIQEAADLEERQEEDDDDTILPKLQLSDVPRLPKDFLLTEETIGSLRVHHHDCFTNEIFYADASFDLSFIPQNQWPLLRLFASLLTQVGSGGRSYQQQLESLQAYTGGISAMLGQMPLATDPDATTPTLSLRGKALYRNGEKLLQLIKDMILSADFTDVARLNEVIQKQATQFKSSLTNQAMNYAKQLATSSIRQAPHISNGCFGLPYYKYITHLSEHFSDISEAIINQLQEMQQAIFTTPQIVISCDAAYYQKIKTSSFFDLPYKQVKPWDASQKLEPIPSQGLIIPSPVAFTAHALRSVPYVHPDAPHLSVASQLFEHITLHKRIREQGGAYGSGAGNKAMQGYFIFYGYRDPNIDSTLKAFKEAIQSVLNDDFTDEELESAKLEVLQSIDAPIAPGGRADTAYIWMREERTLLRRTHFRDGVIKATRADIKNAVEKHLLPAFEKGVTVTLAGKDLLEKENKKLKSPLLIHEI